MYYIIYDREFKHLGDKHLYRVNSYSLTRNAIDFDSIKIVGIAPKEFDEEKLAYVSLHQDDGQLIYFALAGIPIIANGLITFTAVDLRTLLSQECIIDFEFPLEDITLEFLINKTFEALESYKSLLGFNFTYDYSNLKELSQNYPYVDNTKDVANCWKTLQVIMKAFNIYMLPKVSTKNKLITFVFYDIDKELKINLKDFDIQDKVKITTGTNWCVCYNTDMTTKINFHLTKNNTIVQYDLPDKYIYPAKIKVFKEDDISKAISSAYDELVKNMYNEEIVLSNDSITRDILDQMNFSTMCDILGYKKLPIRKIAIDSNGKKQVTIGNLES